MKTKLADVLEEVREKFEGETDNYEECYEKYNNVAKEYAPVEIVLKEAISKIAKFLDDESKAKLLKDSIEATLRDSPAMATQATGKRLAKVVDDNQENFKAGNAYRECFDAYNTVAKEYESEVPALKDAISKIQEFSNDERKASLLNRSMKAILAGRGKGMPTHFNVFSGGWVKKANVHGKTTKGGEDSEYFSEIDDVGHLDTVVFRNDWGKAVTLKGSIGQLSYTCNDGGCTASTQCISCARFTPSPLKLFSRCGIAISRGGSHWYVNGTCRTAGSPAGDPTSERIRNIELGDRLVSINGVNCANQPQHVMEHLLSASVTLNIVATRPTAVNMTGDGEKKVLFVSNRHLETSEGGATSALFRATRSRPNAVVVVQDEDQRACTLQTEIQPAEAEGTHGIQFTAKVVGQKDVEITGMMVGSALSTMDIQSFT